MSASPQRPVRTVAQNRRMHAILGELHKKSGLSPAELDPTLRALCSQVSGQTHTSHLTVAQADRVIAGLQKELDRYQPAREPAPPRVPYGPRGPGPRTDVGISGPQQATIAGLWVLAGITTIAGQRGFCMRQCKVSWPQTHAHADALIDALTAMTERGVNHDALRARFEALRAARLDEWKTGFVADVLEDYARNRDCPEDVFTPHRLKKLLECEAAAARRTA